MKNYPLRVISRRLMLVTGLSLIGLFFLFPAPSVERRVRSAPPEANLVTGRLAYTFSRTMIGGVFTSLYTANADGTGQTNLTGFGSPSSVIPEWSPDGSKIIFSDGGNIRVMNADGTNSVSLGFLGQSPSWSVTGKIAFQSGSQIRTMNPDGTNQAPFPGITQPSPSAPAWSPDGSKLAFSSGGDVWVINADGTGERRITTNNATDSSPAWSPDGSKLAFSKSGPASFPVGSTYIGIAVINLDGTNEMRLTIPSQGGVSDTGPSWSSDNKIAFGRNGPLGVGFAGIFVMNGDGSNQTVIVAAGAGTGSRDPAWQPTAPVPRPHRMQFDFDGDNKDDIAVYRAGDSPTAQSYWHILLSSSNTYLGVPFGAGEDKIVPADYNGDGVTNVAVFRPSTGAWYTVQDPAINYGAFHWGIEGDIPLPGDFDGDGKADLAVYRPSNGFWYILRSSDQGFIAQQFGTSTDQPLLMDYDGDHKSDLAVLRSVGTDYFWHILQSSTNTEVVQQFGVVGDKAVPADYDSDGKTDYAIYRGGTWYIRRSTQGFTAFQYGLSTDTPAPADYDGDGKADAAVFRDGVWYVLSSQSGTTQATQFGASGDKPVPSAYVR